MLQLVARAHGRGRAAAVRRDISTARIAQVTAAAAGVLLGPSLLPAIRGRGAPFVATAHEKCEALFGEGGFLREDVAGSWLTTAQRAQGVANLRFVDLGSGGGGMLRAACRVGGFHSATGFEINPASMLLAIARPGQRGHTVAKSLGRTTSRC